MTRSIYRNVFWAAVLVGALMTTVGLPHTAWGTERSAPASTVAEYRSPISLVVSPDGARLADALALLPRPSICLMKRTTSKQVWLGGQSALDAFFFLGPYGSDVLGEFGDREPRE
jgi:hypothetical protein